jgi:hypothetical protein
MINNKKTKEIASLIQELEFVIYGVYWINDQQCVIGGGGGQGIPNKLV